MPILQKLKMENLLGREEWSIDLLQMFWLCHYSNIPIAWSPDFFLHPINIHLPSTWESFARQPSPPVLFWIRVTSWKWLCMVEPSVAVNSSSWWWIHIVGCHHSERRGNQPLSPANQPLRHLSKCYGVIGFSQPNREILVFPFCRWGNWHSVS